MKRHRKEKLKRFLGYIALGLIAFLLFVAFIMLILFCAVPCFILGLIQYLKDKSSWIYHGKNKKQCYHEPHCLVCYIKLFFAILRIAREKDEL